MRGHVRKRGEPGSWEYIVDVGPAAAHGPLLRAAWILLKEQARTTTMIKHCEECGAPFVVTHGKQRFCPKDSLSEKSRCLARHLMRESRRRARLAAESSDLPQVNSRSEEGDAQ